MANTIQIKRTATSNAPAGLAAGELAYVGGNDGLYIGHPDGASGSILIGGTKGYVSNVGDTITGDITLSDSSLLITEGSDTLTLAAPTLTGDRVINLPDIAGTVMLNLAEDTAPQLGGDLDTNGSNIQVDDAKGILDDSGNEQLLFGKTATAVNFVKITNAAAGSAPQFEATGSGTDVDLSLTAKGAGTVNIGNSTVVTGTVSATGFTGPVTGNITGNVTGDVTGNADTATTLATARTVALAGDITGSASFDGSANISITSEIGAGKVGSAEIASDAVTTAKIADDQVTNAKLGNMTQGTVKVGGAAGAPTDLDASGDGKVIVGNGTDVASVAVSGDVTMTNAGVVTISNSSVEKDMLNDNVITGQTELAGNAAAGDYMMIYDTSAGAMKKIAASNVGANALSELDDVSTATATAGNFLVADGSSFESVAMSGDVSISASGVTSLGAAVVAAAELGVTAGATTASKALVVDASKDIAGINSLSAVSLSGTLDTAAQTNITSIGTQASALSMGSNKITDLATPTQATDAATKAYVDASKQGLDVKDSVRAASAAAGTLASDFTNGLAIDGVTLGTGDRILIKDQATASENGIYVVAASGAPTRASDMDAAGELSGGTFVFVEEGTSNADSGFVVTSNGALTIGTDANTWTQFSGAGQLTAGTGMTKLGNTLDVGAGNGIVVNADTVQIDTAWAGQTAISTVGTISTGTWNADTITAANGGTGLTSYTVGDMMFASGATSVSKLAKGTAGQMLVMNSGATAPEWSNAIDGGTY